MLTLTRRVGEWLRIGDDIHIVVKEVRGKHVRIGIHAPESVKIYREEIYCSIAGLELPPGRDRRRGPPREGEEPDEKKGEGKRVKVPDGTEGTGT